MTPIEKIASLKNGTPIDSISGVLENVYERRSGTTEKGRQWSFQDLILKDKTGTIKVKLNGRKECPKSMEGRVVTLSSARGSKGLEGVIAEDDEYKGKTTRLVRVTEAASVVGSGNGANQSNTTSAASAAPRAGVKVGMALNNANLDLLASNPQVAYFLGDEFPDDLYRISKVYLEVNDALENGTPLPRREKAPAAPPNQSSDENFLQGGDDEPF